MSADGRAVKANLLRLAAKSPTVAAAAQHEEAEIEMTEAKRRTPVDLGALRSSGFVRTTQSGLTVRTLLGFGGAAAPYAVVVHEDLDAYHRVGEAKYLEGPMTESAPHLPARIGRNIARRLGIG